MKKISEFKDGRMLEAIQKLTDLAYEFLENIDITECLGNSSFGIVYGDNEFRPALFSVTKKTDEVYFTKIEIRPKIPSGVYLFELDINIYDDKANCKNFNEQY